MSTITSTGRGRVVPPSEPKEGQEPRSRHKAGGTPLAGPKEQTPHTAPTPKPQARPGSPGRRTGPQLSGRKGNDMGSRQRDYRSFIIKGNLRGRKKGRKRSYLNHEDERHDEEDEEKGYRGIREVITDQPMDGPTDRPTD